MDEKIIRLAALLHDIGKFWQGVGESGTHAELSSRFIQDYVSEPCDVSKGVLK
jgi:CRISPR-associated protein Csm1